MDCFVIIKNQYLKLRIKICYNLIEIINFLFLNNINQLTKNKIGQKFTLKAVVIVVKYEEEHIYLVQKHIYIIKINRYIKSIQDLIRLDLISNCVIICNLVFHDFREKDN